METAEEADLPDSITPEMVEAGVAVLKTELAMPVSAIVVDIYMAMFMLRPK